MIRQEKAVGEESVCERRAVSRQFDDLGEILTLCGQYKSHGTSRKE